MIHHVVKDQIWAHYHRKSNRKVLHQFKSAANVYDFILMIMTK